MKVVSLLCETDGLAQQLFGETNAVGIVGVEGTLVAGAGTVWGFPEGVIRRGMASRYNQHCEQ